MATATERLAWHSPADDAGEQVLRRGPLAYWLSGALAAVTTASCLLTFLLPRVLRGTAVMNGSARGTALAVLLLGVPALAGSMLMAARGWARAAITWLGVTGFLTYNSVMMVFATPFNRLFLLYLAMLALSAWSLGTLLAQVRPEALGRRFCLRAPVHGLAIYLWVIAALNAGAWLVKILPGLAAAGTPAFLRGMGLPTNPVYVQDLALWLPLIAVAAAWLWQRRPLGYLVGGAALVMWVAESVSIAVDQAYGHAADPGSPVASAALTPAFAVLAVIGVVAAWLLLRGLHEQDRGLPAAGTRTWQAWSLAAVLLAVGAAAVFGGVSLVRDGLGMPAGWLSASPFTSWVLPGAALLAGVAAPQFLTLAAIAARHRLALAASYAAGALLVMWIIVQVLVFQRYFVLQPIIAVLGAAEVLLAWWWQRSAPAPAPALP